MIGERVICIKEIIGLYRAEVGKQYTIKDYTGIIGSAGNEYYVVVSDSGETIGWLDSTHFKLLSEVREEKLQEIL